MKNKQEQYINDLEHLLKEVEEYNISAERLINIILMNSNVKISDLREFVNKLDNINEKQLKINDVRNWSI